LIKWALLLINGSFVSRGMFIFGEDKIGRKMKQPEIISHQGTRIFYMDFSGMRNVDEIDELIRFSKDYIRYQPEKSVITLSNIEGMHFNAEVKNMFSEFISGNKMYVSHGAVVGINGLQRIVYNGIMKLTGRDLRSFESIESAKDWLVSVAMTKV